MSTTVDERVVEMRFDNAQFEKNVQTSMSTLEKLKEKLNFSGASKGLEDVNAAAKNVNLSGISNAVEAVRVKFSGLQVVVATALSNITNSAINAGKRISSSITGPLVQGGKNRALNIEQAKFQFEGLGMDIEKAMESASAAVKGTAYGLDAAAKVASQFGASGLEAGDEMTSALRAISGVAAMTSSSYEDIGNIFTSVAGNGRLMGEQLLQLSGRGINAAATLGKALNKTEAEIRKMVSDGEVSFEMFYKAMDEAFGEHAKDANKTFTGALSNVKAALSRIGADIATPAFENLRNIFNALIPVIDGVHKVLGPLITDISNVMKTVSDSVVKKLEGINFSPNSKTLGLSDWKKLVEEGAAGKTFRKAIIDSARSHGVAIDEMIEKEGSFRKTLKNGWLSLDILNDALDTSNKEVAKSADTLQGNLTEIEELAKDVIRGNWGNGEERRKSLAEAGHDYETIQSMVNHMLLGTEFDLNKLSDAEMKAKGYTEEEIKALRELAKSAEETGTPLNELIEKMSKPTGQELLISSVKNAFGGLVRVLGAVKDAYREIFPKTESNMFRSVIEAVHAFSEHLIVSDECADKLKRTFKGLFAALDIIRTIVGGALGIGFKILSKLLGMMDVDILSVTASVGDAIVAFRDWLFENSFFAKAIDKVASVLKNVILTIRDWVKAFMALPQVQQNITRFRDAFANAFKNLPGYLSEVIKRIGDFIGNIRSMDSLSFDGIKNAFRQFKESLFGDFSGVSNPFSGLISATGQLKDDVQGGLGGVGRALESFKDKVVGIVEFLKDKFSNIGIGNILTIAIGGGLIAAVLKISKTMKKATDSFGGILGGFQGVLGGVKNVLNAYAKEIKADAIYKIAKAIEVLAGSVALLAALDPAKMWSAVIALGVLGGGLIGFFKMMDSVGNSAGDSENPLEKKLDSIGKMINTMCKSIRTLSLAIAIISKLDTGGVITAVVAISSMMLVFAAMIKVSELAGENTDKAGAMIESMCKGIRKLALAIALVSTLKPEGVLMAIVAIDSMLIVFALLVWVSKFSGEHADKAGVMIESMCKGIRKLSLAIALISKLKPEGVLMAIVAIDSMLVVFAIMIGISKLSGEHADKAGQMVESMCRGIRKLSLAIELISKLKPGGVKMAVIAIDSMLVVFALLVGVSKFSGQHADKAGRMIKKMCEGILMLSVAISIISKLKPDGVKTAIIAIDALMIAFAGMIAASRLAGKDANKVGPMLLMMSGAILILSVAIGLLSMLDPAGVGIGVAAIDALMVGFAAVIASTKNAKECKSTLVLIATTIGILAIALGALSMIEPKNLAAAAAALSAVMGMFAVMTRSTSHADKKAIKPILVLTLVVGALGGILWLLSGLPVASTLATAGSLSVLLLALSGACVILGKAGKVSKNAFIAIGVMTVIVGALGGILYLLAGLPIGSTLATAGALSALLLVLSGACVILGKVGNVNKTAFVAVGIMTVVVGALGGVLYLLAGLPVESTLATAGALSALLLALSSACVVLGKAGKVNASALVTVGVMTVVVGALGGILWLLAGLPVASTLSTAGSLSILLLALSSACVILGKVGKVNASTLITVGIMTLVIGALGGILYLLADLPIAETLNIAISLSVLLLALSGACVILSVAGMTGPAAFVGVGALVTLIGAVGGLLTAIGALVTEIPQVEEWLDAGIPILEKIAYALGSFFGNVIGGFGAGLTSGLPDIGANLSMFMMQAMPFFMGLKMLDSSTLEAAKNLAEMLLMITGSELLDAIASWMTGESSLSSFSEGLAGFGLALKVYGNTVNGLDTEAIAKSVGAGRSLAALEEVIPNSGGVFANIVGDNTWEKFSEGLAGFGLALKVYGNTVNGLDTEAIAKSVGAGRSLAALKENLPEEDGFFDFFTGDSDWDKFSEGLEKFGNALNTYANDVSELKVGAINDSVASTNGLVAMIKNMDGIDATGSGAFAQALNKLGEAGVGKFVEAFEGCSLKVKTAVSKMMGHVSLGIAIKQTECTSKMTNLLSAVIRTMEEEYDEFKRIGSYLVDGFVKGIDDNKHKAAKAAKSMTEGAAEGGKKGIESRSPSKVFYRIGGYAGQGFINALGDYVSKSYKAGEGMAKSASNGLSKGISKVADVINSGMDVQPTIRPVLDLSAVEAGRGTLNRMFDTQPSWGAMSNINAISFMMNRNQNGNNDDVVSAIDGLRNQVKKMSGNTYVVNGVTYDDGSNVAGAVKSLIRAAKVARRV
jgi:tape measure domain-containing protein